MNPNMHFSPMMISPLCGIEEDGMQSKSGPLCMCLSICFETHL